MKLNALLVFTAALLVVACSTKEDQYSNWRVAAGGSKENIRYSTLTQIDTGNVTQLKVAWTYHSGDADTVHNSQIQCNPIIIDGILFGTSPQLKLFALDAATGAVKWIFNPYQASSNDEISKVIRLNNNRGVTYWRENDDERIFFSAGSHLYSIDAKTGQPVSSFGNNGKIDLHDGLGRDVGDLYVASTSPGIIYNDILILGTRVAEEANAAPGHIRAYDVKTGKQRWIFHTIPQPGEFGYDTWEDSTAYRHVGGANAWSGFSMDEKRGLLFASTGSASADFYGGMRKGSTLFANSILALDAATGKYKWHFQTVHHDVWDMDHPTPPSLVTIRHDGKNVDAIAQATKTGFVFILERETGKPVYPIEERPVPSAVSDLKGEKLWPTQPIPTLPKPFMRQGFSEADLNDLVPDSSYQDLKNRLATHNKGALYMPPSLAGTIFFPGLDGGAEWGGQAFDPASGLFYINANEIPWMIKSVEKKLTSAEKETNLVAGQRLYSTYCVACHGTDRKGAGNYPSLVDIQKKYDEKTFGELLVAGRRMMPAFQSLTTLETKALASFILDLKKEQKKSFEQAPVAIDSFRNLRYTIDGYRKFSTLEGYPGNKPPWGTLNAVNLNTGEIAWKVPLGDYPELKAKGLHTGRENYGGPVVTSSGLVFIGASADGKFRAYNKFTGKLLWETELPFAAFATPSVYEIGGKQYVVIACGGGKLKTKSGDAYVAFALP